MASDSTSTSRGFQSSSNQFQMESSSSTSFAASSSTQVSQTETKQGVADAHDVGGQCKEHIYGAEVTSNKEDHEDAHEEDTTTDAL